jgi:hypothetical protein
LALDQGNPTEAVALLSGWNPDAQIGRFLHAVALFEFGVAKWRLGEKDFGIRCIRKAYRWTEDRFDGEFVGYYQSRMEEESIQLE